MGATNNTPPSRSERLIRIDPNLLRPWKDQPRTNFDPELIESLGKSMQEKGVFQPLVVRPLPRNQREGARYEIISGERRWRAAMIKKVKRIPVIVKHIDDADVFIVALQENLHREPLNPIEEARYIKKIMQQTGKKKPEMADLLGISLPALEGRLNLLELPDEIQTLVATKKITRSGASNLRQYQGPTGQLIKIARVAAEGRLPAHRIKQMVDTVQRTHAAQGKGRPASVTPMMQEIDRLKGIGKTVPALATDLAYWMQQPKPARERSYKAMPFFEREALETQLSKLRQWARKLEEELSELE